MDNDRFSYFMPLQKVVEQPDGTCLVYTRGAQEIPDVSGEIFDYDSSVPRLQKWSADVFKRSQGKSYGNIRAMHGKQASGILEAPIEYNPVEKAVDLVVRVVDPTDVLKCRTGVYTGMSIGGKYFKKWRDGKFPQYMRYTADPIEFSLVDMPNIPTATFDLVKVDGTVELQKFVDAGGETPANEVEGTSESYAPAANAVQTANVPGGEYLVVNNVGTVGAAPNSMGHGVELLNVPLQKAIQEAVEPLLKAIEDLKKEKVQAAEATQQSEELLKVAGLKVGIARRSDEPIKPPLGYPTDNTEYGDPANWGWRYDIGEYARAAVAQFNLKKNRNRYNDQEWNIVGQRVARRATALLGESFRYDPVNKRIQTPKAPEVKMKDLNKAAFDEVMSSLRGAATGALEHVNDPEAVLNALHQIVAAIDVSTDAGAVPVPGTSVGKTLEAAAGKPATAAETPSTPTTPSTPSTPTTPTTPMKKGVDEQLSELATSVGVLAKLVQDLMAPPVPPRPAERPQLLQKYAPLGDLNVVPTLGEQSEEPQTELQKMILAGAARVSEGISTGHVKAIMDAAGGDAELAKTTAMEMVQKSLASRGFTSASKIRTISPAVAAQLRSTWLKDQQAAAAAEQK